MHKVELWCNQYQKEQGESGRIFESDSEESIMFLINLWEAAFPEGCVYLF